mmetsp:Transcript_1417/g.2594  ORF Transcript_1417/g.2594 Transcript_1417/m.2594 type:complete len:608 (+) Transcript_1417:108-1931(+)
MSSSVSVTHLLLSASSPDGTVVAIVAPTVTSSTRHLIQIYQVSDTSSSLQLTLTHSSELPLTQLVFVGTSTVLGLFGGQEVVVWDLNRGVLAAKISASEDQTFLSLASITGQDGQNNGDNDDTKRNYYILTRHGPKLLVQEYQSSNNKLVRKIKSGKWDGGDDDGADVDGNDVQSNLLASLVVTASRVVVRTKGHGIRIMDKDSGKKMGKIKIKASSSAAECPLTMNICLGNPNILMTVQEPGATFLYDLSSCSEIARLPPQKSIGSNNLSNLQIVLSQNRSGNQFTLLLDDTLFTVAADKTPSHHEQVTQFLSENPAALFLRNSKVLALIYQRGAECKAQWVNFHLSEKEDGRSLPEVYKLDQESEEKASTTQDASASRKKRKSTETTVLGPGQAGIEADTTVKKIKMVDEEAGDDDEEMRDEDKGEQDEVDGADDDEDEDEANNMTIGERLQMLRQDLDNDTDVDEGNEDDDEGVEFERADKTMFTFKPRKATTESLKELLTQALQSSDDHLLEQALMVRDTKIIGTTLKEMDRELLVVLLGKLTSRLASTPLRAESLSVWISHCLKRGSFNSNHLAVLRNLLYERIESFSDLLRLEGRLSMMVD